MAVTKDKKEKRAIIFIDGSNWYHNVKSYFKKPKVINLKKLAEKICENFDLKLEKIYYYNGIPLIEDSEETYYKHMVFLAGLKRQGINVKTRKLKKITNKGVTIKIEKGVDVMIAADMVDKCLLEDECDCCVLVSGDSDFVPIMHLIKKQKKEVITASVIKGYAREMLQGDFRYLILKKKDLESCFST